MIVATAGHVDHGKTSLVRSLTGVNTDRLDEEKRRGLSIVPGFAFCRTARGRSIGFIVVLTKVDRASPRRQDEVASDVAKLLPPCPSFRVSNLSDQGIATLRSALENKADTRNPPTARGRFRMSVDRAFSLRGAGLIVTGTALSGQVSAGETMHLFTAHDRENGIVVRVRSVHANGEEATGGMAGQRCALNLVGKIERNDIARGDWICAAPGGALNSLRFDAELILLGDSSRTLSSPISAKLYVGAKRLPARILPQGQPTSDASPSLKPKVRRVTFLDHNKPNSRAILEFAQQILRGRGTDVADQILVKQDASLPMTCPPFLNH